MSLHHFKTHLSSTTFSLAKEGLDLMEKSQDPVHDIYHITRILHDLNRFAKEEKMKKADLEVLVLAICWHDVWKAQRLPKNTALFIYHALGDGIGSMRHFARRAQRIGLAKDLTLQVKYAIRKHARVQILPRKSIESKILWDLDLLEEWSLQRLKAIEKVFLIPNQTNPKKLKLVKFYLEHFMLTTTKANFYFEWSKKEFQRRRKDYLVEVNKLLRKYMESP